MAWGAEKRAGFALAALLGDDRTLDGCSTALPSEERRQIRLLLDAAAINRKAAINAWLMQLKPRPDASFSQLPERARTLVASQARGAAEPSRTAHLPTRAGFAAEPALLQVLLRCARMRAEPGCP